MSHAKFLYDKPLLRESVTFDLNFISSSCYNGLKQTKMIFIWQHLA
jgi:hypothetical protein